jgi:hypothetical protein
MPIAIDADKTVGAADKFRAGINAESPLREPRRSMAASWRCDAGASGPP